MTDTSKLYKALKQKAGLVPAEETPQKSQLKILCRMDSGKMPNWKVIMHRVKKAEMEATWSIDISKVFFLKNNSKNGPLVHGWRVIIKAPDLQGAIDHIAQLVTTAPNARVELEEVVLPGGGAHRNYNPSGGKGANMTSGSRGSGPAIHLINR